MVIHFDYLLQKFQSTMQCKILNGFITKDSLRSTGPLENGQRPLVNAFAEVQGYTPLSLRFPPLISLLEVTDWENQSVSDRGLLRWGASQRTGSSCTVSNTAIPLSSTIWK